MFGWRSRREKLLEEIESHLDMATQQNIEAGMPPDQAKQAAKKRFGNVLLAAERSRSVWGAVWLENLLRDIRYAWRSLSAAPGYSLTLVSTLALGLGSVTVMLAIIQSVLLLPVNLPHPERLVQVYAEGQIRGITSSQHALSYAAIDALRREARCFADLSGYNTMVLPVKTETGARVNPLMEVTPDFFQTLGVPAQAGRLIQPADANTQVVVVSDRFWRSQMRGSPRAIGEAITISGRQWTVIGILPATFHAPGMTGGQVVFLPISAGQSGQDIFKIESAAVIARLKDGISLPQARAEAQSIFQHSGRNYAEQQRRLGMRSYQQLVTGEMQRLLWTLLGAALVLLLIACANAGNLQIGRSTSRMTEMNVRSALGAGLGRLMQQLLTENILASLLGAVLGSGLAFVIITGVRRAYAGKYPRFEDITVHPLLLCASCALAVAVGILASLAPTLKICSHVTGSSTSRNATQRLLLPGLLVATQVALTCMLLATSGLFVCTLRSLQNVKLGFNPKGVTTLVLMPENQQQNPQISHAIEIGLLHRFEALPGVQSVTMQSAIPFSHYDMTLHGATEVVGWPFHQGDFAYFSFVSTNFVQASGIHLLRGRGFVPADESSGMIVALVNEAFAGAFLNGRQPLGASLQFHRDPGETEADIPFAQPMTIVGVVQNEVKGGRSRSTIPAHGLPRRSVFARVLFSECGIQHERAICRALKPARSYPGSQVAYRRQARRSDHGGDEPETDGEEYLAIA